MNRRIEIEVLPGITQTHTYNVRCESWCVLASRRKSHGPLTRQSSKSAQARSAQLAGRKGLERRMDRASV